MPNVAAPSPLSPIATRTPLIAITAVHALCSTTKIKLVRLTSQVRPRADSSVEAEAEVKESLVSRAISVPTYRRAELLSSDPRYFAACSAKFPINRIL